MEKKELEEEVRQVDAVIESYKELRKELLAKAQSPEMKERGKLVRNYFGHGTVLSQLENISCPVCGSNELGWMCHHLDIHKAAQKAKENLENGIKNKLKEVK
jgi:hypothetical protein